MLMILWLCPPPNSVQTMAALAASCKQLICRTLSPPSGRRRNCSQSFQTLQTIFQISGHPYSQIITTGSDFSEEKKNFYSWPSPLTSWCTQSATATRFPITFMWKITLSFFFCFNLVPENETIRKKQRRAMRMRMKHCTDLKKKERKTPPTRAQQSTQQKKPEDPGTAGINKTKRCQPKTQQVSQKQKASKQKNIRNNLFFLVFKAAELIKKKPNNNNSVFFMMGIHDWMEPLKKKV